MRYEFSDYEWTAIKQMLPNKPRGVRRANDRRVLDSIFLGPAFRCAMARPASSLWSPHHLLQSLRSLAASWRLGPDHDALAAGQDAAVQMIDTSVVRVHQHGACMADNNHQDMGRSRGGA